VSEGRVEIGSPPVHVPTGDTVAQVHSAVFVSRLAVANHEVLVCDERSRRTIGRKPAGRGPRQSFGQAVRSVT
jgi:hypothetical protein